MTAADHGERSGGAHESALGQFTYVGIGGVQHFVNAFFCGSIGAEAYNTGLVLEKYFLGLINERGDGVGDAVTEVYKFAVFNILGDFKGDTFSVADHNR